MAVSRHKVSLLTTSLKSTGYFILIALFFRQKLAHRGFEPPVSAPRSAASWAGLDEWAIAGFSIP